MPDNAHALKAKKAVIIGLGVSGRSAARFLLQNGACVAAADDQLPALASQPEVAALARQGLALLAPNERIAAADLVVLSPGVPLSHPLVVQAHENKWELIGEAELACRFLPQPMVAITGTNGKTTVTFLVAHVLRQAGMPARAAGNSGVPLTSYLDRSTAAKNEILAVELSSYQLETLQARCLDAAVLLNISADHLDRYRGMDEYAAAKLRISQCLKPGAPFFVEEKCASHYLPAHTHKYGYEPSCTVYSDLVNIYFLGRRELSLPRSLQGKPSHEIDNLMAAYALCRTFGVSSAQFAAAFATFIKPPHRIEFVRQHKGVSYVDDSKGTNLDAVMRAVAAIEGRVILIAGGVDKGASYTPWIHAFAGKVRCICAIGQAAEKIEIEVGRDIPTRLYPSLDEAVLAAAAEAKPTETVLLSPGCASFDMFKDYAHRGDEFKRIVQAL